MPVVTISRQFGSYGDAVAELLCDRLRYRSLDKGALRDLAAQASLKPDKVINLSEDRYRLRTRGERFFANAGPLTRHPVLWAEYGAAIGRERLAEALVVELINAAYAAGNMVIVGRGGQVVLREQPDVLHVRLIASLGVRARRHQIRAGLNAEEARQQVLEADRTSAEFMRRYHGADVADPALYDLIINTDKLPPAAVADLVIDALTALLATA